MKTKSEEKLSGEKDELRINKGNKQRGWKKIEISQTSDLIVLHSLLLERRRRRGRSFNLSEISR